MRAKINGLDLFFEVKGEGRPILLIHGFPLNHKLWEPQISALVKAGFKVITPDLRGFGESEAPADSYSMDLFSDDLAGLLDFLKIERAIIGGMSMGGYILLNFMERYPDRIEKAILMVTRPGGDTEAGREWRTSLMEKARQGDKEAVVKAFEVVLFEEESFAKRRDLVDLVRSWMRATPVNGMVGGLMAMRDRKDYKSLLPELTTPTGVIVAELDKAVKLELAKEFEKLPQHKFVVLKGAGHMVNMERPEILNRALVEFLKICKGIASKNNFQLVLTV